MSTSRDDLVVSHLFLARAMARKIKNQLPSHVNLDDLVSAGYVGLVQAADKFDWRRKTSFYTFAAYRIRGAIYDVLRQEDWVPRLVRQSARESGDNLPEMLTLPLEGLPDLPYHTDAIRNYEVEIVSQLLSWLDDRSRRVISMRYLDGLDGKTIAAVLRISTSRVSEINKKALSTMRRSA